MFRYPRFWTYILTNWDHTVLYIGITNNLPCRLMEHYAGVKDGFSAKYKTHFLVWYEETKYVLNAIALEKDLKAMRRSRKEEVIARMNPLWNHLNEEVIGNWPPTEAQIAEMTTHRRAVGAGNNSFPNSSPSASGMPPERPVHQITFSSLLPAVPNCVATTKLPDCFIA